MAVKKQSEFLAKLGKKLQSAHDQHKDDETKYGPREVPAGIKNGVAKVTGAKIDKYKSGELQDEFYIRITATIIEPKVHNNIPCDGIQFGYQEPLCDTPKSEKNPTFAHHLGNVYNELRKLGIDTSSMEPSDLEEVIKDLETVGPYFTFDSWAGKPTTDYPNPRVNVNWNGILVDYAPDGSDEVVDNTSTESSNEPESSTEDETKEEVNNTPSEESTEEAEETEETQEEETKESLQVDDIVEYKYSKNPDVRKYMIVAIDESTETVKIKEVDNPKAPILSKVPISKLVY